MATDSCQRLFSLKAFKGKGEIARQIEVARARLATVWEDMAALTESSKQMPGHSFYLFLHRYTDQKGELGITLRWRMTGGKHATWEVIRPIVGQLPVQMQQWYREANVIALYLNMQDKTVRTEIRNLEQLLKDLVSLAQSMPADTQG
jgi:hypothetical protein